MSGHSKWSSIKHKKALTDAKKGKVFSRLSTFISIAAKHGGDPTMNPNLRLHIEKAKQAGMPKENIERAIKRGTGELGGAHLEEVFYEAYGPEGVGIIIEGVTDNKNRTVAEIKAVLNKYNGKLAETGAVSYLFEKKGVIVVSTENNDIDEVSLLAIDAGAEDIITDDEHLIMYTLPGELEKVKKNLEENHITIISAEITLEPKNTVQISDGKKESIGRLVELLDDLEDVTEISTNADV